MRGRAASVLLALGWAVLASATASADTATAAAPDRVVVGFTDAATAAQRSAARASIGATGARRLGQRQTQILTIPGAGNATLARLRAQAGVRYAEPAFTTAAHAVVPNPGFPDQWALDNIGQSGGVVDADIDAQRAWDLEPGGSSSVLVGWADSGTQRTHPGLAGLHVLGDTGMPDQQIDDDHGHGTSTSSIVFGRWSAASRYAGLAPESTYVSAKVLDGTGSGTTAQLAQGLRTLGDQHVRVVNVSLGGPYSQAVHDAIADHPDTLYVASAGNSGRDVDARPSYPCEDVSPNVICVAASTDDDTLASFSNFGASGVDLAAPGERVPALALGGGTGVFSGTSFAAPFVTGTAALAFAARPTATAAEVKHAILASVDGGPAFTGKTATGGRLNAYQALALLLGRPISPRPAQPTVSAGATLGDGAPGTASPVGDFPAAVATHQVVVTAPVIGVTLTGRARRQGARAIALTLTCVAADGCAQTVRVVAGARVATVRVRLSARGVRRVVLRVRSSAAVRSVRVTVGTGAQAAQLAVRVA